MIIIANCKRHCSLSGVMLTKVQVNEFANSPNFNSIFHLLHRKRQKTIKEEIAYQFFRNSIKFIYDFNSAQHCNIQLNTWRLSLNYFKRKDISLRKLLPSNMDSLKPLKHH